MNIFCQNVVFLPITFSQRSLHVQTKRSRVKGNQKAKEHFTACVAEKHEKGFLAIVANIGNTSKISYGVHISSSARSRFIFEILRNVTISSSPTGPKNATFSLRLATTRSNPRQTNEKTHGTKRTIFRTDRKIPREHQKKVGNAFAGLSSAPLVPSRSFPHVSKTRLHPTQPLSYLSLYLHNGCQDQHF